MMQEALKVFLVEDSEVLARLLTETIAELPGLQVVGQSGSECQSRELIHALHPEVVILDINLKEGNGISLLKKLREEHLQPRPIVYILTNHAFPEYRRLGEHYGADAFFDKTSDLPVLCQVLARLPAHRGDPSPLH
jgi:two-component system, OmpR family, response regulator